MKEAHGVFCYRQDHRKGMVIIGHSSGGIDRVTPPGSNIVSGGDFCLRDEKGDEQVPSLAHDIMRRVPVDHTLEAVEVIRLD